MFKELILENENRRKIYAAVEKNQGIHFRDIQRLLDMPLTTLEYHLSYLTRKQILYSEREGNLRRYYTKPLDAEDKKVLSALRQNKMREIVLIVVANQKAKYQFLAEYLGLPNSTLSFYLKYLVDGGILLREKVGYENIYTVKDEERVSKVLVSYKQSFLDKLVDKALSTWLESYSGKQDGLTASNP